MAVKKTIQADGQDLSLTAAEIDSDTAADKAKLDGEAELWLAWRKNADVEARERIVDHYLPYARIVAASYYRRRFHNEIEFEEYLQLASVGLLESIDRFDPAIGAQFKTFASRRMHGAILNGLEKVTEKQQQIAFRKQLLEDRRESLKGNAGAGDKGKQPEELFKYLADVGIGLALAYLLEGSGMIDTQDESVDQNPYQKIELEQLRERVRSLVNDLSQQERTVIRYHYLQEMQFSEVADLLKLSKGRIAQIHKQALDKLRRSLQGGHLDIAF